MSAPGIREVQVMTSGCIKPALKLIRLEVRESVSACQRGFLWQVSALGVAW